MKMKQNKTYITEERMQQIVAETINNYLIEEGFMQSLGQGVSKVANAYNTVKDNLKGIKDAFNMGRSKITGKEYQPTSLSYLKTSLQDLYNVCNSIVTNFYKGDGQNDVLSAINQLSNLVGGQNMKQGGMQQNYMNGRYGGQLNESNKTKKRTINKVSNNNTAPSSQQGNNTQPATPPSNQNTQQPIDTSNIQGCIKVIKGFYNNARALYASNPSNRNFGVLLNKLYKLMNMIIKNLSAYYKTDFNSYSDTDRILNALGNLNKK